MKILSIMLLFIAFSCSDSKAEETVENNNPLRDLIMMTQDPICPEGEHTDSIVEIHYGYPSERMWEQADSGLIAIGGCELSDETHYCQIHEISFEHP